MIKAAESLYISPSAFSHALGRLRGILQDPLFIRIHGEMKPTQKANEIAPIIFQSLEMLSINLFDNELFEYKTSSYEFSLGATDYTMFSIVPMLLKQCRQLAPHLKFKIYDESKSTALENIQLGKLDIIGYSEYDEKLPTYLESFKYFSDQYVVLAAKGKYQTISLKDYLQADHIRISSWNEHSGIIDQSLHQLGLKRNIIIELPHIMSIPHLIESSDLIITLPYKAAQLFKSIYSVEFFDLPFNVPKYDVNIFSLKKEELNAQQRWLINQILDQFKGNSLVNKN